jgi:trehalose 6-phosphate synthase
LVVDAFPVGIDVARIERQAGDPETIRRSQQIREELGHPETVLLGVDRLDYTKGIEVRLRAYRELLEEGRVDPARAILVQVAEPSRDDVPGYSEIRAEVERLVGGINGDFDSLSAVAVKYVHHTQGFEELVALYRCADVMLVTPFRDGMNLVAKEYVAANRDRDAVLILSEFAGAAHELSRARIVNPYDVVAMKDAIDDAVNGSRTGRRAVMASLARSLRRNDARHWADRVLGELDVSR